jgi:transposase InsO family protein
VITESGVRPDPAKIRALENFQTPATAKQLKSFLGMAGYYRKFIQNFSRIASPLHTLLKKDAKFEWNEAQEHAFQKLKSKLTTQPILQYPDFTKEFIVTTDASNGGLGAVLSQGEVGKDLPVAYASRSLNKAETHYSTSEKELLAIVWALKYFRPYLYGRKFKIVTDHKPLIWLMNVKDPGSRLLRWRIKLEEYHYEILYKRGSLNANADALSRIGNLRKDDQEVDLDEDSKKQILYEFHDAPLGGHRGMNKTYKAIKAHYSWTNMRREIEDYVKKCQSCQVNKLLKPRKKAPMEITTTAVSPFERCSLDIVGPLPETEKGNKYILTFQDDLSKYVIAVPIRQQDANTVAKEFVTQVVLKYGTPNTVLTDQGANFLSDVFRSTCKLLKIKKIQSTAFHPETNGGLERSHRVLAEYLRHYIREDQSNWDEWIPFAMFTYNTTEHTATGYTPFELVFGRKSTLPSALMDSPSPQYNYDDYVTELKNRLQTAHQVAKENLLSSKARSKEHFDRETERLELQVGDRVLLYDETVRRGRSKKLSSQWIGPYEIVAIDKVNVTIKRGKRVQKVHVNRIKPFY